MATRAEIQTTRAERRTAAAQRTAPNLRTISERDVKLLAALEHARANAGRSSNAGAWLRVRDMGGVTHSWHANALQKLARHELVEPSYRDKQTVTRVYRITKTGRRVLAAVTAV